MSTRIVDLLLDLSQDPFKAEQFRNDPESIIRQTNLDPSEGALLIDADTEAIGAYLAAAKKKKTAKKKKPNGNKVLRIPTNIPEV